MKDRVEHWNSSGCRWQADSRTASSFRASMNLGSMICSCGPIRSIIVWTVCLLVTTSGNLAGLVLVWSAISVGPFFQCLFNGTT